MIQKDMTYRFKVTLPNIKGFHRIYEMSGRCTLYHFHKQMVADMDFPSDQLVLFKAFNTKGELLGKFATFDLGNGSIDQISIEKAVADGITEFVYFYDTVNKLSVIINYDGEGLTTLSSPTLVESKGPNPQMFLNGYVAMEDLSAEKRKELEQAAEDGDDFFDEDEEEENSDEEEDGLYGSEIEEQGYSEAEE
ncbi:MAG: hypothetical protein MJY92_05835 [Bacteroidales bacterium]|nr:hypothetical protein [Bacteroidales bacterium]